MIYRKVYGLISGDNNAFTIENILIILSIGINC